MKKIIFIGFIILFSISCNTEKQDLKSYDNIQLIDLIERVEPPNWWVGMKTKNLQILVYGNSINDLIPKISNSNIELISFDKVKNENYLFLNISISENAKPDEVEIDFYKNNVVVDRYIFSLLNREKNASNVEGFNSSDVMYLITPDRFANGDSTNDDIKSMFERPNRDYNRGLHGGDIKGIINHLDYIKDLGFTTVWLNPVLENNMKKSSYHGYSTTDYYKVDPRFGSNELFQELSISAKEKGIKLVMDLIPNHCGSEHWFFKDPPMDNWFNNQSGFKQTSHRRETVQDIYASEIDKREHADGWFVETMPDLNQKNQKMSKYLIQNTLWWIEYARLSGIRVDTYPYSDKDFMSDWTFAVMDEYPNFNIVGEEWSDNPIVISYWQKDKINHDGYVSYLPTLMDFPLQISFTEALLDDFSWGKGFIKPYKTLASDFLYPNPNNLLIFPDNHDMTRFFTQVNNDIDLFKMGIVYYSTMRGIPQFYYGTEILMNSDENPGDHGLIRTEFPGGWPDHSKNAFTGDGLSYNERQTQLFFKEILNWRKDNEVIHNGKLIQFAPKGGIYSFFRILNNKMVWVIFNRNNSPETLETSRFDELIENYEIAFDIINKKKVSISEKIIINAKSALILEIE
ncbi:glycoside hydrolase family 13 protein [Flavobacteriaceae bacterium]|nr:glycoside hydrolase family 13 protein [Flavobacteriaceae bacterium]MDC1459311.1 glycoside hydrolase family 13 protein [Flavobacteriaceae bacterium]